MCVWRGDTFTEEGKEMRDGGAGATRMHYTKYTYEIVKEQNQLKRRRLEKV